MSWLPRYYVEINGVTVATVVKEFTFFRQSYRVEGLPWRMEGNFWAHDYVMYDNSQEIMKMRKSGLPGEIAMRLKSLTRIMHFYVLAWLWQLIARCHSLRIIID